MSIEQYKKEIGVINMGNLINGKESVLKDVFPVHEKELPYNGGIRYTHQTTHHRQIASMILLTMMLLITIIGRAQPLSQFITKSGDKLYEGQHVFKFIGINAPTINGYYDGYRNTAAEFGYAYDPIELSYEMESYFTDMSQMGITVFRNWGITVADGSKAYEALVTGANTYNEVAFRRIDKMLQLCNRYGMRVILCLVKENRYWGGTAAFSALHGGGNYYTDSTVKEGFKRLLHTFANRKNFYTGVTYKNDKAILAWEFGNEVPNNQVAWIDEMSTYLKGIDSNHLIGDPRRANGVEQMATIVDDVLHRCKSIDFVKTRQYPNYRGTVDELWTVCQGKIPLIIDEFQRMDRFEETLQRVEQTGTSGVLLWSLMKNQYKGGIGGHALYHAYSWGGSRWPGFNSGAYFNEEKNLIAIRDYSFKIRRMATPPLPAPYGKPYLYKSVEQNTAALKWRCTPGARYYVVERAKSKSGPWTNISGDIDISFDLYFYPMFTDSSAIIRAEYYYRVIGKNASGITSPSNIVGPVSIKQRVVMDNLFDFSKVYYKSSNLVINAETWPRLRQTEEDFSQAVRQAGSGAAEMIYKATQVKSIKVFVFNNRPDSLLIECSRDGLSWSTPSTKIIRKLRKGYASEYSGQKDNPIDKYTYEVPSFPAGTMYVKLTTGNSGEMNTYPWIGRVHLGYDGKVFSGN